MQRYIRAPAPRQLVSISGQKLEQRSPDGATEPVVADMRRFVCHLLMDPRFAEKGFESIKLATEILVAVEAARDGVWELPDAPHWALLAQVAREPRERAKYDSMFAPINYEFALSIIGASLEDPRKNLSEETRELETM